MARDTRKWEKLDKVWADVGLGGSCHRVVMGGIWAGITAPGSGITAPVSGITASGTGVTSHGIRVSKFKWYQGLLLDCCRLSFAFVFSVRTSCN